MTVDNDMHREIGRMDGRLEALEKRVDGMEVRIDARLTSIEAKLDALLTTRAQAQGAGWAAKALYGLAGTGAGVALIKLLAPSGH